MDATDRALGAVIRRKRAESGMSQKDMAERLGVSQVVYGRIELGTRAARAVELRDISQALGVSMESLIEEVMPVTPEEMVERSVARRDAAYSALHDFGQSVIAAVRAVTESDHGAAVTDQRFVSDAEELVTWLQDEAPLYAPLRSPAELIPHVRQAIENLAASVNVAPLRGTENDDG